MNRLGKERSLYLKKAAGQKIHWYPWCDAAFEAAHEENKPVFLSSGAAWCHWCHVMATESFEDDEVVRRLNEDFICIKLDHDERPDIDRRYQQAVASMGNGSGWPLSVFLTPDRQPFYGGTYFPVFDRAGRPGFRRLLAAVKSYYHDHYEEVLTQATSVMGLISGESLHPEDPEETVLDEAEEEILSQYDPRNGGFGSEPKFPMTGAIEFLLRRYAEGGHEGAGKAARHTLLAMVRGGVHDQVGGGFHRYSVDAAWCIPHFEKMADDNAGLLRNYMEAYVLFGDDEFRQAAEGILRFSGSILAVPGGGFGASQDADVTPDDEGGYFTWTDAEMRAILTKEEYEVISLHLVGSQGRMHHDPEKTVLIQSRSIWEIAASTGRDRAGTAEIIRRAKDKLLAARRLRKAPLVDLALYPSLNGMLAAAWFRASMALADRNIAEKGLIALERIMEDRRGENGLFRVPGINAVLEDYIHTIDGCLAGYEATGRTDLLVWAEDLMNECMARFLDPAEGGFFDTDAAVLGTRWKRIEDTPHPSANAVAVQVLLTLWSVTGTERYRFEAERSLRLFSSAARQMGVHGGSFFCALHAYYAASSVSIEAPVRSQLADTARRTAIRTYAAVRYGQDQGRVILCARGSCSSQFTAEGLAANTVHGTP